MRRGATSGLRISRRRPNSCLRYGAYSPVPGKRRRIRTEGFECTMKIRPGRKAAPAREKVRASTVGILVPWTDGVEVEFRATVEDCGDSTDADSEVAPQGAVDSSEHTYELRGG